MLLTGAVWGDRFVCLSAGAKEFGQTEGAVIVIGSGIAGLSTAASLHKVSPLPGLLSEWQHACCRFANIASG